MSEQVVGVWISSHLIGGPCPRGVTASVALHKIIKLIPKTKSHPEATLAEPLADHTITGGNEY